MTVASLLLFLAEPCPHPSLVRIYQAGDNQDGELLPHYFRLNYPTTSDGQFPSSESKQPSYTVDCPIPLLGHFHSS
jgi:hypothetical protein